MFYYNDLLLGLKKGIKNGNWWKLDLVERALYKAALCFTKIKGKIVNQKIVEIICNILLKLLETPKIKILKRGIQRAIEILVKYEQNGVFRWAPSLKKWLHEKDYIEWLGTFTV